MEAQKRLWFRALHGKTLAFKKCITSASLRCRGSLRARAGIQVPCIQKNAAFCVCIVKPIKSFCVFSCITVTILIVMLAADCIEPYVQEKSTDYNTAMAILGICSEWHCWDRAQWTRLSSTLALLTRLVLTWCSLIFGQCSQGENPPKIREIGKIKGTLVRKVPGNLRSQEFVFFSWAVFLPPKCHVTPSLLMLGSRLCMCLAREPFASCQWSLPCWHMWWVSRCQAVEKERRHVQCAQMSSTW